MSLKASLCLISFTDLFITRAVLEASQWFPSHYAFGPRFKTPLHGGVTTKLNTPASTVKLATPLRRTSSSTLMSSTRFLYKHMQKKILTTDSEKLLKIALCADKVCLTSGSISKKSMQTTQKRSTSCGSFSQT